MSAFQYIADELAGLDDGDTPERTELEQVSVTGNGEPFAFAYDFRKLRVREDAT